jgi:glucosylceramidase
MDTLTKNSFLAVCLFSVAALGQGGVTIWLSSEDGEYKLSETGGPAWEKAGKAKGAVITVDPEKEYQSILGLGASLEHATCENLLKLPEAARTEVIRKLVDPEAGIGMNLMRICIGTSDFTGVPYYSYCETPEGETDPDLSNFSIAKDRETTLPIIKKALELNPEMLLFASPWSPPAWMKTTGKLGGGKMLPEFYGPYAQYFVKFLMAYAEEGVPVHAVTVQNEPHMIHPGYPTCFWSGEMQRDFIRDHLGPVLRENHFDTRIWCWDHNWNTLAFPRAVLSDSEAAKYVEGTGFHLYEGKVEAQTEFREEFPEKDIFFTEGSTFRAWGAQKIVEILRNWSRSYNAWVIMLDENRKPNRGPHTASATCIELKDDRSVKYRFDYYMYGQFMKFIPRGAVRIASTYGKKEPANVAFRDPEGRIVLVVVNTGRKPLEYSVVCGGKAFKGELPGRSVATCRWQP